MGARRLGRLAKLNIMNKYKRELKRVSALSPKARVLQALQIGIAIGTGPSR